MPRPHRLNIPGMPQHVTQRGNNRQACFYSDDDYRLYLALLLEHSRANACSVHAYVLMSNHVHLLITPSIPDGISRTLQGLGRDYVRRINRTCRRTGTLQQGRFKSSLVDTDRYCMTCYRHIELNPVRAGMVNDPSDCPRSNYPHNGDGRPDPPIPPHDRWLLPGTGDTQRTAAYRALISESLEHSELEHIRNSISTGLPTGNDRFRQQVEQALARKPGQGKRGRPKKQNS